MAVPVKRDIINMDLLNGNIHRSFFCKLMGAGDQEGDRFQVRVFNDGVPVDLRGCSVVGYFIRPDGATDFITGWIDGNDHNVASITVPKSCYSVAGTFSLSIKVTGTEFSGTLRVIDGTIINTTTNAIVDPGNVVDSLNETLVERAEDAAEIIERLSTSAEVISGDRYKCIVTLAPST